MSTGTSATTAPRPLRTYVRRLPAAVIGAVMLALAVLSAGSGESWATTANPPDAAAGLRVTDWAVSLPGHLLGAAPAQQAYFKSSNNEAYLGFGDQFGDSVAVSGDTVVVGAPYEDSSATGVNGNQADNSAESSGAAYVFVRSGSTWTQQAYLKASNTNAVDLFGSAVAISGDTLVVGAWCEDSSATGVNGSQADNSAYAAGAAYVFVREGGVWTQQAYLKASNTQAGDHFGLTVAISGDTIVVGALAEASSATGVNGNQGDNSASFAGAAYVFVRSGTTWAQQAYLKASNTGADDLFSRSVSISGETVVVGADGEDSNAAGINGNQSDNSAESSGAAYVFSREGTTWSQQAYLKASNAGAYDLFGISVAASGETILVGACAESSDATGVNGNQANNDAAYSGAAYVFARSGAVWSQQAYLKASNTDDLDGFGRTVALSGDMVVVAAVNEDSNATGVNGDQNDNSSEDSGAAYVFTRSGAIWAQQTYLKASNTDADDVFGCSMGASGDTVLVSTPNEDSNATGINGDQNDNTAWNSGAAYVFTLPSAPAITGLSPATGPATGGTVVTITGTDFIGVSAVTFGGVPATSYSVDSGTQITATAPAHDTGTVRVRVTTAWGASANTPADDFTYCVLYNSIRGTDRFDTALLISQAMFPGALPADSGVVLAPGWESYQEALCGAPLAAAYGGPVLLNAKTVLYSAVRDELVRLAPDHVFLIGLTGTSVAEAVQVNLPGASIHSINGSDVYHMSYLVAKALGERVNATGGDMSTATGIVTIGSKFPDAIGVSPLACYRRWPVLLTDYPGDQSMNEYAVVAMQELGITTYLKAGTYAPDPAGITGVGNCSGSDRYYTNAEVAVWAQAHAGLSYAHTALTTGDKFPDALAGGPYLAQDHGTLLLSPLEGPLPDPIATVLAANAASVRHFTFIACIEPVIGQVKALLD